MAVDEKQDRAAIGGVSARCSNNHQLPCAAPAPSLQLRPLLPRQAIMCPCVSKANTSHSLLV